MRIIIAEDELLERKAMKKFIREQFSTMQVVAEAANGRKAIALAAALKPDLMLMDIKMPGVNGLEAIETIHTANPTIKFILVSAYDSFAYAKEAMRFGIKDYILKPGRKEEIIQALLRVEKEIRTDQQHEQEKIRTDQLWKQQFLNAVMQHPVADEAKRLQQNLFPAMRSCSFIVIKTASQASCIARLQETIDMDYIVSQTDTFVIVCLIAEHALQKAELLKIARNLQQATTSIGLGDIYTRIDKLPDAYQAAYSACLQHESRQSSGYGFLYKNAQTETGADWRQFVFAAIEKGHSEQAENLLKKYLPETSADELEGFYIDVMNLLRSKHLVLESGMFSLEQAARDWHAFAKLCAMKMNAYYQSKKYAAQIESYIQDHFQEKISLEDAADAVNLSPSYFSNLFKQEFGINFTDYINRQRMEAAKAMIEENKLSIKEISYMLGYKDPNYFSRVFKKYFAESPKSFQKSILQ